MPQLRGASGHQQELRAGLVPAPDLGQQGGLGSQELVRQLLQLLPAANEIRDAPERSITKRTSKSMTSTLTSRSTVGTPWEKRTHSFREHRCCRRSSRVVVVIVGPGWWWGRWGLPSSPKYPKASEATSTLGSGPQMSYGRDPATAKPPGNICRKNSPPIPKEPGSPPTEDDDDDDDASGRLGGTPTTSPGSPPAAVATAHRAQLAHIR